MSLPAEARDRQAAIAAALRDLALDVERSIHLGVGIPDDEIGGWAQRVEQEIEESTTTVLLAARALQQVTG